MHARRLVLLLAGVAALCGLSPAGRAATPDETLAEAIAEAYRTNPTLGASRYDVRQADEGVAQALSQLRPTVDLQATATYDYSAQGDSARNPFSPAVTNRRSNDIALSVVQPLFTGGKATADRRSAEAGVGAARQALRGTEGDLLLAVTTAYLDVRRYTAELEVWRGSIVQLEQIEQEIEARRMAGELTRTDVAQARNQLQQEREQAVASEQQLEAARADFVDYVGHQPGALAPPPPLPGLPPSVDQAFASAEQRNPELARAVFTERGSRAGIVAARAEGTPTVALRGTATLSGDLYPYRLRDQNRDVTAGVVLSVPLSAGGRIASQIRQAQDRNGQDRLRIEATRRDLMRQVVNGWNALVSAQRAATLIEGRRAAAAIQMEGTLAEYRVGLRSTFDVLYAQQSLRSAQVSALGAERDRYVAAASLLRRTGDLEVGTLIAGVSRFDPARHLAHAKRTNALPWDGAVGALDALGAPSPAAPPVEQPAVSAQPAMLPGTPPPTGLPLARGVAAPAVTGSTP